MIVLIAFIIFIISLGGIILICRNKIPELKELPVNGKIEMPKIHLISSFNARIKKIFAVFHHHVLLHKILFSIKCIVSKTEHSIDNWLHHIRKKAQEKKKH